MSWGWAQQSLEIIPLRHATVDQVLPTLRPLLEPGATLGGQSGQLFLRASPANTAEIRRVLEAIDRPRQRLQISVRFDDAQQGSERELAAGGRISNRGSQVELRAQDSRSASEERVDQRVQVLEGGRAYIATGQSRTLPQRQVIRTPAGVVAQDTFVVQEASTGFEVMPRLSGDRVMLDIAPRRESLGDAQRVQSQSIASTVSGRLGEWIELGGMDERGTRDDRGIASSRSSDFTSSRKVWVKVEALPDR